MGGETVLVGRVRRPHGVRGELVVESLSDVEGRFAEGAALLATPPAGAARQLTLAAVRAHRGALLVRFAGVTTRDEAESLRGADLEIPAERRPAAPDGAFYYSDLIGCQCRDESRGSLGRVQEVLEDGGGLLLGIESEGRRLLVPFVRAYLRSVDVAAGEIELALPEGLIETCESTS